MGFSVLLTSLVFGSHLSFPDCQLSTLHPVHSAHSFISFHILSAHHSQTHCCRLTRRLLIALLGNLSLNQPNYRFFFPSHTFGLHVAAVEKHSTVPTPISFGLHFQSHCPLNTAQGFFYKPALQNCSSIKPLLFSLSPHLSAVLLKSPPPPLSKSCLYILSSLPRCPRRTCTLILLEDSTWALDPFPSQLACLNQSFLFSSLSLSLSSLALH